MSSWLNNWIEQMHFVQAQTSPVHVQKVILLYLGGHRRLIHRSLAGKARRVCHHATFFGTRVRAASLM